MRTFSVEEITQIVGGMLTKEQDATITQIAPPLLSDENTLALALSEEEIANLANSKAKAVVAQDKFCHLAGKTPCINAKNTIVHVRIVAVTLTALKFSLD